MRGTSETAPGHRVDNRTAMGCHVDLQRKAWIDFVREKDSITCFAALHYSVILRLSTWNRLKISIASLTT